MMGRYSKSGLVSGTWSLDLKTFCLLQGDFRDSCRVTMVALIYPGMRPPGFVLGILSFLSFAIGDLMRYWLGKLLLVKLVLTFGYVGPFTGSCFS